MADRQGRQSSARGRAARPLAVTSLAAAACFAAGCVRWLPAWAALAGGSPRSPPRRPSLALAAGGSLEIAGDLEPLSDYLLVKPREVVEMTKGGLLLPTSSSSKPNEGTVLAVGPGKVNSDGRKLPMWSEKGMQVLYGQYGTEKVDIDDEEHLLLRDEDIFLSYTGEEATLETIKMPPGKVLVRLREEESQTEGGLFLSKGVQKQDTDVGEVVAVAEGAWDSEGKLSPLDIAVGDSVRFRYGNEVDLEIGGSEFRVVDSDDCLAKWR